MCGILGKIYAAPRAKQDLNRFIAALDTIKHRGPDDYDTFHNEDIIFGHRRLSIIDLSPEAKQPMLSEDGKVILNFNGEIYNYLELKDFLIDKGYKFRTSSDSEVLLYLYYEKGIDCLQDLIGMFAFAIHDTRTKTSYIVRDRLGIKPLYYNFEDGNFTFASEQKAIISLENQDFAVNRAAFSSYLSFRYPILGDTYFEGIKSLAPGSYLHLQNGKLKETNYWSFSEKIKEQEDDKGEQFYLKKLREILLSAVKYRMIADVPTGAFLSGGVDSSVIVALMSQLSGKRVNTFTIGFDEEGYNEFSYANQVAKRYNTNHREIILSGKDYISTMEKLIGYKDGPLSVPNEVPLYLMSKELKKYITVVLSGEGADEIFGGYGRLFRSPHDYYRKNNSKEFNFGEGEWQEFLINHRKRYGDKEYSAELDHFYDQYCYTGVKEKESLLQSDAMSNTYEARLKEKFETYFEEVPDGNYYNKIMYAFEKLHIVGLLHRVDMTTMAASVEARVPFVDHRLVEFAFTIPVKYKLKWKSEKDYFLAKVLNAGQISEVYDTPKYILKKAYEDLLPKEILYRKKMGFPVPLNNWFGGEFNNYAKEILLDSRSRNRNLFNLDAIEKRLKATKLKEDHGFAMKIWMLINIELFNQQYFDK